MITSEAVFNLGSGLSTQSTNINFLETPVIGDATETALVRFF